MHVDAQAIALAAGGARLTSNIGPAIQLLDGSRRTASSMVVRQIKQLSRPRSPFKPSLAPAHEAHRHFPCSVLCDTNLDHGLSNGFQ